MFTKQSFARLSIPEILLYIILIHPHDIRHFGHIHTPGHKLLGNIHLRIQVPA